MRQSLFAKKVKEYNGFHVVLKSCLEKESFHVVAKTVVFYHNREVFSIPEYQEHVIQFNEYQVTEYKGIWLDILGLCLQYSDTPILERNVEYDEQDLQPSGKVVKVL